MASFLHNGQQRISVLSELPPGLFGRFVASVDDLLLAEHKVLQYTASTRVGTTSRDGSRRRAAEEAWALRRRLRALGEDTESLGADVRRRLRGMLAGVQDGNATPVLLSLPPLIVALEIRFWTLARLRESGCLAHETFTLLTDVDDLRAGWQLCGGLALAAVSPSVGPLHRDAYPDVIRSLRELEACREPVRLAFTVPILDVLSARLQELSAWSQRTALTEKDLRADARGVSKIMLAQSTANARRRLAGKGFDAALPGVELAPAHLEHCVPWDEYRSAERLLHAYQRRGHMKATQFASVVLLPEPAQPKPLAPPLPTVLPEAVVQVLPQNEQPLQEDTVQARAAEVLDIIAPDLLPARGQPTNEAATADIMRRLRRIH